VTGIYRRQRRGDRKRKDNDKKRRKELRKKTLRGEHGTDKKA